MYLCSDTNIWIDFDTVGNLSLPFLLEYEYLMSRDSFDDELLSPPGLREKLLRMGLIPVELNDVELQTIYGFLEKYSSLSVYDLFALAIARNRGYILLTGDRNLRKAAMTEGVSMRGTLWVFDQLLEQEHLTREEYFTYMRILADLNGGKIRLPAEEKRKRME